MGFARLLRNCLAERADEAVDRSAVDGLEYVVSVNLNPLSVRSEPSHRRHTTHIRKRSGVTSASAQQNTNVSSARAVEFYVIRGGLVVRNDQLN
jgi:hypothetical protein